MWRAGFVLVGVVCLAACGGGGGPSGSTTPQPPGPGIPVTIVPSSSPATPTPSPTPAPTASPAPTPGIMAIGWGGNTPETVAVYRVGQSTPLRTFSFTCCGWQLAFDAQGDLIMATSNDVEFYAPNATTPFKTLPQGGFSMALSAQGDVAVGGYNMGSTVAVYPGGVASAVYRIPGQPAFHSLAFDASGELAVPQADGTVKTFPHGSTTANRTIPVNGLAPSGVNFTQLAYDRNGNLALAPYPENAIAFYPPGSTTASYTVPLASGVDSFTFDAANDLIVGNRTSIRVFAAGTSTLIRTVSNVDGYVVAVDPLGNIPFAGYGGTSGTALANGTVVPITGTPNAFGVATYPSGSP